MTKQEILADIAADTEIDPTFAWQKSEKRLSELMLELAEDQLKDRQEAVAMISAIENRLTHPLKETFIDLNYPVVKAWCTVKAAVDCSRSQTSICH